MRIPSARETVRDVAGNAAKIYMDNAGIWDRLVWFLCRRGWIPKTLAWRIAAILGASFAVTAIKVNMKTDGLFASIIEGIVDDTPSELGGRILKISAKTPLSQTVEAVALMAPKPTGIEILTARLKSWSDR